MTEQNWYQLSIDAVEKRLGTSDSDGISRAKAKKLHRKFKNNIYPVSKITFYQCIRSMTMDYTSYLLILTALIAAVFEESVNAWPVVIMVVLNLIAVLIAYTKAQKTLEGMDRYTLPVVRVIREGRLYMLKQTELVPGDLICLSRGDIVPADARLISDEGFCVDETYLFGQNHNASVGNLTHKIADVAFHETVPPHKQRNMVFASTLVTSGEARAIVTATGEDTVVCITDKNRPIITHENMPILGTLARIGKRWSLVVIAAVFGLTLLQFLMPSGANSLFNSFIKSMSFAVSTMSEMYVAFGCIVLACAILQSVYSYREKGSGAIIKNALCMENLKKLTCLVLPKEGVFTTRESTVDRVMAGDHLYDITDRKARRAMERPILYSILSTGSYGLEYLQKQSEQNAHTVGGEEESAILNLARSMEIYNVRLDRAYPCVEHRAAGRDSLFETTLVKHKEEHIAISRGDPELILSRCSYYYKDGRVLLLTPEIRAKILQSYKKLVRSVYSAVAIASRVHIYNNLKHIGAAQREMVFEGMLAFRVPYLRGVGQLITDAKEAGIKVILLSERSASEEYYFARQLGIVSDEKMCIDGPSLAKLKVDIRRTNATYYRVYCGLDTAQKQELLMHLRENGERIGVLGRDLSDLCLMRAADVSFTQNVSVETSGARKKETVISRASEFAGEDGCEALKFESDIIVSDADRNGGGGFAGILDTVRIARDTDRHVLRIIRCLLCSQAARFLIVLYTILFAKSGMSATQALFSGLFCDFFSVLVLALQRPSMDALRANADADDAKAMKHPVRANLPYMLLGVMWGFASILSSLIATGLGAATTMLENGSVLFITSTAISIVMLFSLGREDFIFAPGIRLSALHGLYLLTLIELFLLFFLFPTFGTIFGVAEISAVAWLVVVICLVTMLAFAECVKVLARMHVFTTEEDTGTSERHAQITALFHMFRAQKEEEERAQTTDAKQAFKPKRFRLRKKPESQFVENADHASARPSAEAPTFRGKLQAVLDTATMDTREVNGELPPSFARKKKKFQFKRTKALSSGMKPTQGSVGLFDEDELDYDSQWHKGDFKRDDVLAAAMAEERSMRRAADVAPPTFHMHEDDELDADEIAMILRQVEEEKAEEERRAGEDFQTLAQMPDIDIFEEAVRAVHEDGDLDYNSNPYDVTVGGITSEGDAVVNDSALRRLLRGEHLPGVSFITEDEGEEDVDGVSIEEAADREFPGLGYLFSEEEYEAIMAEYAQDGTNRRIYNTETQSFDTVGGQTQPFAVVDDKTK